MCSAMLIRSFKNVESGIRHFKKLRIFVFESIQVYVYVPTPPLFNEEGQLSSSYDELPTYPL